MPSLYGPRDYNIVTQGKAIGDGKTLNTKLFSQPLTNLSKEGGGRIIFPKGSYLTGCIQIKSGIELYLEKAVILGSTNPDDYYPLNKLDNTTAESDNSKLVLILGYKAKTLL